jgi:phosphopantothenoylcysteine synthetase/decarboxylase
VNNSFARGVLYIVICGSPRAGRVGELITRAQAAGWDTCVVATPDALRFIDPAALEQQTGHPVPYQYRRMNEVELLPPPDAIIACPATFNTINKLAAGVSDTFALGLLTEAIGKRLPLVIAPSLNSAQAAHWAFARSIAELRAADITVLYGPGVYEPGPPGTGGRPYPWDLPLHALHAKLDTASQGGTPDG